MNAKENKDELRAKKYLQTLKHTKIEYEPLGNVTPDFLIDNKIAVEVRRLNRNHINSEQQVSVENLAIAIIKNIKKMIEVFKSPVYSNSAYISLTLSRALDMEDKTAILKRVDEVLENHIQFVSENKTYPICDDFYISFTPIPKKSSIYIFNGCNDDIFWIAHELQKSIQIAIDEKDKKIERNFKLYEKWWLILIDSISYGMDAEDFKELKHIRFNKGKFTKVIIVSPKGDLKVLKF